MMASVGFTFLCVSVIFLQCVTGTQTGIIQRVKRTTGELTQKDYTLSPRQRSNSWSPGMDVSIRKNNMNVLVPKVSSRSLDSLLDVKKTVPVYRTEAAPNQRLNSNGVISLTNSKGKENTLWMGVGSKPKRTEQFMQKSKLRETKDQLMKVKDFQNSLNRMLIPIDYQKKVKNGQLDYVSKLKEAVNEMKSDVFNANDQTIRSSQISPELARKIISSSIPEGSKNKPLDQTDRALGKSKDVINTDIRKGHNQFGISGDTLTQLKNEIKQSGVKEGTTFNRRRSEPAIAIPNHWVKTVPKTPKKPKVTGQTSNKPGTIKSNSFPKQSGKSKSKSNTLPKSKPKVTNKQGTGTSNTRTGQRTNSRNGQTNPSQQSASRNSRPTSPVQSSSRTRNGSNPLGQTERNSPSRSHSTPRKTNISQNRKKN